MDRLGTDAGVNAPRRADPLGPVARLALALLALGAIPAIAGAAHLAGGGGWGVLWWPVVLVAAATAGWAAWVGWITGNLGRRQLAALESVLAGVTATGVVMWLTTSLPHVPDYGYPDPPAALAQVVVTALAAGGLGLVLLPVAWRSSPPRPRPRQRLGALARIELALLTAGMWSAIAAGSSLIGGGYPVRALASEWYEGEHVDTFGMLVRGSPVLVIGMGVAFLVCVAVSGIIQVARPSAVSALPHQGTRVVGVMVAWGTLTLWVLPTALSTNHGLASLMDARAYALSGALCGVAGLLMAGVAWAVRSRRSRGISRY